MSRRWAKEPAVGEGPPNDARVDSVVVKSSTPTSQAIVSTEPSTSSASGSTRSDSSTFKTSTSTTTMVSSTSTISSSFEATATPETIALSQTSLQASTLSNSSSSALPTGAIIGIAIGGAAILGLITFLAYFLTRRRQRKATKIPTYRPKTHMSMSSHSSRSSKSQTYSKVSTSSNQDSSSITTSDTSEIIAQPEIMYSAYCHPDSTEEEMRPHSSAETDALPSTFKISKSTPTVYSSNLNEERLLTPEGHEHWSGEIEGPEVYGSAGLTVIPIPRKSSKRKVAGWNEVQRGVKMNHSGETKTVERLLPPLERRSTADYVISEVDHLIERWDTISIRRADGRGDLENLKVGDDHEDTAVRRLRTMSSCVPSVISDEALESLGVGRRTGSFPRSDQ